MSAGERDEPHLLDVRPERAFLAGHRRGAVNIPLEELDARMHELPPRDEALLVFDDDAVRAAQARDRLALHNARRVDATSDPKWLIPTDSGPSSARLWRPHALLDEALPLIRAALGETRGRRAVDLASGTGRDAVALALAGFDVEAIDILPDALERAADLARRNGVSVRTQCMDLERQPALGVAEYDLVTVFRYLHRPLLPMIRAAVRPGGFVVYETFLVAQRAAFGKPRSDAHLLQPGELRAAFADWQIVVDREGPAGARQIVASLVARRLPTL